MIDVIRAAFLAKVLREKELLRDTHWSGRSDWPKEGHCGCYECPHDGCSSDTCSAMDALEAECKAARADLDEVLAGGRSPRTARTTGTHEYHSPAMKTRHGAP